MVLCLAPTASGGFTGCKLRPGGICEVGGLMVRDEGRQMMQVYGGVLIAIRSRIVEKVPLGAVPVPSLLMGFT